MRHVRQLLPFALLGLLLLAGCGGDGDDNPFEGDWISASAGRLTFTDSTWQDSDGDSGRYSYTGDYPVYTIVFESGSGDFNARATFADERTFELCRIGAGGELVACRDFALNKPTLH